jgi:hypothetical protein
MTEYTKSYGWTDVGAGIVFATMGLLLVVDSRGFPGGAAGVPGPAFFPMLVGSFMTVLGLALAFTGVRTRRVYWDKGLRTASTIRIGTVVGLTALYVVVWDAAPFLVRTPVYVFLVYRILGESWIRSALLAAAISTATFAVFDQMFGFRL